MRQFKDFIAFSENNKGNLSTCILSSYGSGLRVLKKMKLLNGLPNLSKPYINSELFSKLKNQTSFFFNLEKNKIFLNIEKKKKIKNYNFFINKI